VSEPYSWNCCPVRVTHPLSQRGSGIWPGNEPNKTKQNQTKPNRRPKTGQLVGYPDPLLTLGMIRLWQTKDIKGGCLVLEDFRFFSLYSFSCTPGQIMTLKQLRLMFSLNSFDRNFEDLLLVPIITFYLPISPPSDHTHYTIMPLITSYLILNVPTSLDRM
jgi:hypothetical protein